MLLCGVAAQANGDSIMAKANRAYLSDDYNLALELYTQAAKEGTSATLFYNLGNTYYRLRDNAHAILSYEKALRLDPGMSKARKNLEFVREKAKINSSDNDSFLGSLFSNFVQHRSSNSWATIAVIAFILGILAAAAFLFMSEEKWRKLGFYTAIIGFIVTLLSVIAAIYMSNYQTRDNEAIVTASQQATLSTVPRIPAQNEIAFTLPAGTKVEITDSINSSNDSIATKWYSVVDPDNRQAWIKLEDIEKI